MDPFTSVYGHQFHLLCYYSEFHECYGQTEWQCLELVCLALDVKSQIISSTVPVLECGSRRP